MITLLGVLKAGEIDLVNEKTRIRFKDSSKFKTPEALVIYEQGMLNEERLLELCCKEYNIKLETPRNTYIPRDVIDKFYNKNCVPISYDVGKGTIYVGTLPEFADEHITYGNVKIEKVLVPIYYYVSLHIAMYGQPDFLLELPIVDKLSFIIEEAINKEASEITISNVASGATVYYNVRKKKIRSKRSIESKDVLEIAKLLATRASSTLADNSRKPRYISVNLDLHNRGRVVINKTYHGNAVTIRILPNALLTKSLEDLNIGESTCKFIRKYTLSQEKGLRLFIGETMSGKNTTILSSLLELVVLDSYKIVSLEQPVEILVDSVEQIDAETDEEFELNADSLQVSHTIMSQDNRLITRQRKYAHLYA